MMEISGAGDKLVVIDFCVTWTKSCKKMESKVKELSKEEPNVIFLYVDTDIVKEATYKFNLFVLPFLPSCDTLLLVRCSSKLSSLPPSGPTDITCGRFGSTS